MVVGGTILYYPAGKSGVAGGLRWVSLFVALSIGIGFVVAGIRTWNRGVSYAAQMRIPSILIGEIRLLGVCGGVLIFRPWAYDGLAGGLRVIALIIFVVVGLLLAIAAYRWYQSRTTTYPLVLLALLTGFGAFYPLDDAGLMLGTSPLEYGSVLSVFVALPVLAMYYNWRRISRHESI